MLKAGFRHAQRDYSIPLLEQGSFMKRLAIVLSSLSLTGCVSLAEAYTEAVAGGGGGYASPATSESSAIVEIYTPASTVGLQGQTIFNLPVAGRPLRIDYYLSRNRYRAVDQPAVPWRGLGGSAEVRVHVQDPLYVAARAQFDGRQCNNQVAFQPLPGRRYRVTQVYSGMSCGLQVIDTATATSVDVTPIDVRP